MSRWYGSLESRLEENKIYGGKGIYVGMGATQYLYSDRHPYEVIEVINDVKGQEEVVLRQMDYKVVKGSCQYGSAQYEYIQNENGNKVHLKNKKGKWYEVHTFKPEEWEEVKINDKWRYNYMLSQLTETRRNKFFYKSNQIY